MRGKTVLAKAVFNFKTCAKRSFVIIGIFVVLQFSNFVPINIDQKQNILNQMSLWNSSNLNANYKTDQELPAKQTICVLILACSRPTVKRCLDAVLKYLNSTYKPLSVDFPVIVSQDCGYHPETATVIESYGNRILHLRQPDQSRRGNKIGSDGYYKQTRHYRWALNHTYNELNCSYVIVLEDDLQISPDFFEYFAATLPILEEDPSIHCVTASNFQARPGVINETAYELLYRTDYFYGLGFMLSKDVFTKLGQWPADLEFWDVWIGEHMRKRNGTCIRPEIPRTKNFGKDGVSGAVFFDVLVRDLISNDKFVPFTSMDLSYLKKETYDNIFAERIKSSYLLSNYSNLDKDFKAGNYSRDASFRIVYHDINEFFKLAHIFRFFPQHSNGMVHTVYKGVLTCMFRNHRFFLVPDINWKGYNSSHDALYNFFDKPQFPIPLMVNNTFTNVSVAF